MVSPKSVRYCVTVALFAVLCLCSAHGQVVQYTNETAFLTAAPNATNNITFEGQAQAGFLPTFTELGYVTFNTNPNYSQEIIDGSNIGSPNNTVYTTLAADLTKTITDITFDSGGVTAVGFDLKNTGNNATTGTQGFLINVYSGSTLLNSQPFGITSPAGGTSFQFTGFTSSSPITELTISSYEGTPNQNVVLDNFDVAAPAGVPEPATWSLLGLGALGSLGLTMLRRRRA